MYFLKSSLFWKERESLVVGAGWGGTQGERESQADFPLNMESDLELHLMTPRS